jgi:REP element-mobilizing transposase RayT
MSGKYKTGEAVIAHFVTCTVVGWVDAFSREAYKDIVVKSLAYCKQQKGMMLYAYVIMTNHLHLIIASDTNAISDIMRDFKKFTSKQILAAFIANNGESRREWMLNMFGFSGINNSANKEYQFWQHEFHPILLDTFEKQQQRLLYLHQNPVRAGIVWQPLDYKYSSAIDYYTELKDGLLSVEFLS